MNGRLEPGGLAILIGSMTTEQNIGKTVTTICRGVVQPDGRAAFPNGRLAWLDAGFAGAAAWWVEGEGLLGASFLDPTPVPWRNGAALEKHLMSLNGGDEEQTAESDGLPMAVAN